MKKISKLFMLGVSMFCLCSCNGGYTKDGKNEPGEGLVVSDLPESVVAELGERYTIPFLEVTMNGEDVSTTVSVIDPEGQPVELISRNSKFFVDSLGTYVVTYAYDVDDQHYTKILNVVVEDNKGPEVKLPSTAYNMNVKLNQDVTLPTPVWTDISGEVLNEKVSVKLGNTPVTITDNKFKASEFGLYEVTYSAEDVFGNKSEEKIIIECSKSIILESFDTPTDRVWASTGPNYTTEHAVEGTCFKVSSVSSWTVFAIYPKYYDLSGFNKFRMSIYADADMNAGDDGFYLLNKRYTLEQGENTLVITKDDMNSMYPGCQVPSSLPSYYDIPYLWFQVRSASTVSVYVDNFEGILNTTAVDTAAPTIDIGNAAPHGVMSVNEGDILNVPVATAYDDSLENISVTYKVEKATGEDITSEVNAGTFKIGHSENYKIIYSAQDSSGNKATKTITVKTINKSNLPDMTASQYFPTSTYDVLQDFEDTGCDWTQIEHGYSTEHVMSGSKSLKLSTQGSDTCVVLKLTRDGTVLTNQMWKEYSKIRAYVYADNSGARFDFYGNTHNLNAGPNIVEITGEEIVAEIGKAGNVYDHTGGFYFQLTKGTVYVDAIIGIY